MSNKDHYNLTLLEKERVLECAMRLLPHAEGWTNRAAGFDPVAFSLREALRMVIMFRSISSPFEDKHEEIEFEDNFSDF